MSTTRKKIRFSEEFKAGLLQWWVVGAVYFFIGFGTGVANTGAIDFIFFLGVSIAIAHIVVFYPIAYNMFTLSRRGEIINKKYFQRTIPQNVMLSLGEVFRCMGITILVYFTYHWINVGLVAITNDVEGTVLLPGEPVLFAIFFMFYFTLSKSIMDRLLELLDKTKKEEK
ncbi:MAG: hypothetical protein R3Y63_09755 [Eubacteriales bacterium]